MARNQSLLVLAALALVIALVAGEVEQYGIGAVNRGATGSQAGNLAASAYGKQFAEGSNQAAQQAKVASGEQAAAHAALNANAAAYGKNAYEQRIAQSLVGVLSYCEGYICTEWLDEYGAAYTNAGASAKQSAEGFGEQHQQASQFTDAQRAAFAAEQQAAIGQQARSAAGALQGTEAYGQGAGATQAAYGAGYNSPFGGYGYGPAAGGLSGAQAAQAGAHSNVGQYGAAYGKEAAGVDARQAASEKAGAIQGAAAQAKLAQANAAAAKQSAFTVEQLSRLKNYGRKCRRYQCYSKYWDGSVVSYGPNYYTATGQAANQNQAQAAQHAAFADQAARAQQAAYGAEAGAANQYGAGAVGANEAAYGSGYGGSPYGYGY